MKNIFSRFLAKSLLGLSLLAAPALSLACGPTFDALGTALPTQSSLTVYWNNTPAQGLGVNSYRIAYRVSGSSYWFYTPWSSSANLVFSGPFAGGSNRSRAVTGLQVGTTYDFMLWGRNTTNGNQYDSDIVQGSTAIQTSTTPCYKPTDVWGEYVCSCQSMSATISFQVDGGNFNSGRISWGPSTQSATAWMNSLELNQMGTPTGTLTYSGLQIPDGMSFRVGVSCSSSSELTWSNVYALSGSGCWNKEAQTTNALSAPILSVYPNPSNGAFRLTFNTELEAATEFNVLDINGKTVLTQTVDRNETEALVDMTGNSAGVYFLKFNGETKKIVLR